LQIVSEKHGGDTQTVAGRERQPLERALDKEWPRQQRWRQGKREEHRTEEQADDAQIAPHPGWVLI